MRAVVLLIAHKLLIFVMLFIIAVPLWLVVLIFRHPRVLAKIIFETGINMLDKLK